MCDQMHGKTYNEVKNISPTTASTLLMSTAVKAAEKQKLLDQYEKHPRKKPETNQVIFQMQSPEHEQIKTKTNNHNPQKRSPRMCFRCGETGHISKTCQAKTFCTYCKIKGHVLKVCKKKEALGKYCNFCKMENSHSTNECYKKKNAEKRPEERVAQAAEELQMEDPDKNYEEEHISAINTYEED